VNRERHVDRRALPRIQKGHKLEVEGVVVGRLDRNAHRKPDLEVVSDANGVVVDMRDQREQDAEVPAEAVFRVRSRGSQAGDDRGQDDEPGHLCGVKRHRLHAVAPKASIIDPRSSPSPLLQLTGGDLTCRPIPT
jgi:hypothetical protein